MTNVARGEVDIALRQGSTLAEVQRVVEGVKSQIASLSNTKAEIPITAETRGVIKGVAEAKALLDQLEKRKVELEAKLDTKDVERGVNRTEAYLNKLKDNKALAGLNTQVSELKRGLDDVNTSMSTNDRIKTLTARSHAKEAVEVANLAKRYKDLSNELEKSTFREHGLGKNRNVNIEAGIDDRATRAQMDKLILELRAKGRDDIIIHMKTADKDTNLIKRTISAISNRIGDLGEKANVNVNFGPFSGQISHLAAVAAAASPILTSLGGALVSLVGVAGAGALGAGAIGGGLFTGLAVNLIGVTGALKTVKNEYDQASKAQTHFEETVAKYGAGSKRANMAYAQLQSILQSINPASAEAAVGLQKLKVEWKELTFPTVRTDISKIFSGATKTGTLLAPGLAENTNKTLDLITAHVDSVFRHMREGPEAKAFVGLGASANKFLGPALGGLEKFGFGILHVFESAAKIFAGPLGSGIFQIGKDFQEATKPGKELDATIKHLGEDAKLVYNFFKELGRVIFNVLQGSVGAGEGFVTSMTKGLGTWNKWLESTKGKNGMAVFFGEAVKGTEALWSILAPLTKLLFTWAAGLTPAVNTFLKLAQGATDFVVNVGKLVGLKDPLASLGVVIGTLFFVGKIAAFTSYLGKAYEIMKAMIALGSIKSAAGLLFASGGAGAAAKAVLSAPVASAGTTAAVEAGAAGAGASVPAVARTFPSIIAGLSATTAGTVALSLGAAGAAVAVGLLGKALVGAVLGAPSSGGAVADAFKETGLELKRLGTASKDAGQRTYELGNSTSEASNNVVRAKLAVKNTAEAMSSATRGTLEYKVAAIEHREAVEKLRKAEEVRRRSIHDTKAASDEAVGSAREEVRRTKELAAYWKKVNDEEPTAANKDKAAAAVRNEASAHQLLVRQLNAQAGALLNINRSEHNLAPVVDPKGVQALGELGRHQATKGLAVKLAIKYELPEDVSAVAQKALEAVRKGVHPSVVLKAIADTKDAHSAIDKLNADIKKAVADAQADVKRKLHDGGVAGVAAFKDGLSGMGPAMTSAFGAAIAAAKAGIDKVNKVLEGALTDLGIPKSTAKGLVTGSTETNLKTEPTPFGPQKKAQGGLVQFGQAGERGRDSIPANMIVGPGEQGAVFTHQQQAVANEYLAPIGGLPGLFNKVNTPHWMGKGGFYPGPQGRIDQGVDYAGPGPVRAVADGTVKSVGLWPGWPGTGGIVYSTPRGLVYVMENFTPSVGKGAYVRAGQIIGQDNGGKYGIETGWADASGTGPLVRYNGLPDGTPTAGGKSFAAFLGTGVGAGVGAAMAAVWKKINSPQLKGSGPIHQLAQTTVDKLTAAANKVGEAQAAKITGPASGEPSGKGAGNGQMRAWAKAGLIAAGKPGTPSEVDTIVYTMNRESGGNPRSENTTDSNARAGHPSRGLMELIPENFAQYHVAGTANNVFDPVANVAAAVRYMIARYGHIVAKSPYEKGGFVGGKYNSPALLVGEHENEYVINPKRADNAAYLMQAGEDMGYHVTAAAGGKHAHKKAPAKPSAGGTVPGVVSPGALAQLNLPAEYAAGGVPEKEIAKLLAHIEGEYKKEFGKLTSLRGRADKEKGAVAEAKHQKGLHHDKATYAAVTAIENAKRAQSNSVAAAKAALDQAQSRPIEHKTAAEGGSAAAEKSKAHSVEGAQKRLARAEHNAGGKVAAAEKAAKHKISEADKAAIEKLKKAEAKLKDTQKGIRIIDSDKGGKYEDTKWPGFKTVVADMRKAREDKKHIEAWNEKMEHLDTRIADDQAKLTNIKRRWQHFKDIGGAAGRAGMADETKKFNAILHDRRLAIDEQRKFRKGAFASAQKMKQYAEADDSKKEFSALENKLEKDETGAETASDETKESEEDGGPEKAVPATPPSAEEFVKQQGKLEGPGGLQSLERDYALSQTKLVPDNPNTPVNEELPGLKEERKPAEDLTKFWEEELQQGLNLKEPDVTIKDLASQVTSARATSLGLIKTIEEAEKNQTSTGIAENTAFSQARLQLYKDFGSNFQPLLAASAAKAIGKGLATSVAAANSTQQPQGKTVSVNVINHFSEPPANPHHWSNGLRWELGSAI